jgi:hypothetical protein
MKSLLCFILLLTACSAQAPLKKQSTKPIAMKNAIEAVLTTQARAWNEGHIDVFMEHYWNSEQLTFSSGGKTTRGWQQTLEGYKKRYPNKEIMAINDLPERLPALSSRKLESFATFFLQKPGYSIRHD